TPLSRVTIARVSVCPQEYSHCKISVRRCRGTSDRCDNQHVRWPWQRSWLGVDLRCLLTDLACIDDELERIRVLMLFHQLEIGEPFRRSESAAVRKPCLYSVEQAGCHGVLAIHHETLRCCGNLPGGEPEIVDEQGAPVRFPRMVQPLQVRLPVAHVLVIQPVDHVLAQEKIRQMRLGLRREQLGRHQVVSMYIGALVPATDSRQHLFAQPGKVLLERAEESW